MPRHSNKDFIPNQHDENEVKKTMPRHETEYRKLHKKLRKNAGILKRNGLTKNVQN